MKGGSPAGDHIAADTNLRLFFTMAVVDFQMSYLQIPHMRWNYRRHFYHRGAPAMNAGLVSCGLPEDISLIICKMVLVFTMNAPNIPFFRSTNHYSYSGEYTIQTSV